MSNLESMTKEKVIRNLGGWKRHIFWKKSHGKVSFVEIFLYSKTFSEMGEMLHSLSQRGMDAPDVS